MRLRCHFPLWCLNNTGHLRNGEVYLISRQHQPVDPHFENFQAGALFSVQEHSKRRDEAAGGRPAGFLSFFPLWENFQPAAAEAAGCHVCSLCRSHSAGKTTRDAETSKETYSKIGFTRAQRRLTYLHIYRKDSEVCSTGRLTRHHREGKHSWKQLT